MTISIDSSLMVAVSTKRYTNHPHDTVPFRDSYTFELDLFNVLSTLWPIGTPKQKIIDILSSCSNVRFTCLYTHKIISIIHLGHSIIKYILHIFLHS